MPKIMVTDDSAFMRELIMKSLKKAGYKDFIEAGDGETAVKTFKEKSPDLVLLDIVMGGNMDGIATLKEIKNINKSAKIIMVTVVDQPKVTEEANAIGASGYVTKPIDPKKLVAAVDKALGNKSKPVKKAA